MFEGSVVRSRMRGNRLETLEDREVKIEGGDAVQVGLFLPSLRLSSVVCRRHTAELVSALDLDGSLVT